MPLNKVGQKYKNFVVTKYIPIDEIQCELIELRHEILGTEVIKIRNKDEENLFCLSFKTWPSSSDGAAHILEHTVLCGSKKFPVKDPFFSMLRRSLNTFMNAMTGADFTCYPAASLVEKDFYNLFEVYIDAVFHPLIDKYSFMQEGHRFEFSNPEDASSPLIYKGVVYNEMKGSMASPDNRLYQKILEKLTPDLPYTFNSGGDPNDIPKLTHENLINFHKKFYHPSRCLFFLYGNLDLEKQLDFIENKALKDFEKKEKLSNLPKQKRFSSPLTIEDRYPIDPKESLDDKAIFSFSYLTCLIEDQIDLHALILLDHLLMGTDGAYLKLSLLRSNLCKTADSLMDTDMSEIPFFFIMKGCKKENFEALFNVFIASLEKLTKEEIPKKLIEASLHQLELSRTEITHDAAPYGLTLFFRSALSKQHGIETESALVIHTLFKQLRKKLEDKNYLPSLIKKYFLENKHLIKLMLLPDPNLLHEEEVLEREKLDNIQKKLTPENIENILHDTSKLKKIQKEIEGQSLECLPKVALEDVALQGKKYPLTIEKIKNFKLFYHDVFTNDILYVDLLFDLPSLTKEEEEILSLFTHVLTELGVKDRSYIENLEFIESYTGGISSYLSLNIQAHNFNDFTPSIAIKTKALYRNSDKLFSLLKDTITSANFEDSNRIKELILQQYTFLENSIVRNSMRYATIMSQSSLTEASFIAAKWNGPNYLVRLKSIIKDLDKNIPLLIEKFKSIIKKVFCQTEPHLVISCDKTHFDVLKKNNFYNFLDIELKKENPFVKDLTIKKVESSANIIPAPISFTASSYKTISFLHEDSPALLLASQLFENKTLHKKIREIGGAYGSGASFSASTGIFTFTSFRDPHINSTLKAFKSAIQEVVDGDFSDDDITQAKLGIIQHADSPSSPGSRAYIAYSWLRAGKTDEIRQEFRQKLLTAQKQEIIKAVKNHLLNQIDDEITISFTGKELFEKEQPKLKIANFIS